MNPVNEAVVAHAVYHPTCILYAAIAPIVEAQKPEENVTLRVIGLALALFVGLAVATCLARKAWKWAKKPPQELPIYVKPLHYVGKKD